MLVELSAKACHSIVDNYYQMADLEELPMISADLGARLEDFVSKLVESGRYGSKSEVLREGVRLIEENARSVLPSSTPRSSAAWPISTPAERMPSTRWPTNSHGAMAPARTSRHEGSPFL